jgi:hypothetical protein
MTQPTPEPQPREWECLDFRRYEKKTLQGFGKFRHAPTGLEIVDCPIHQKNGRRWINFPAKQFEKNGEKAWTPIVEIQDRDQREIFQRDALHALNRFLMSPAYQQRRRQTKETNTR